MKGALSLYKKVYLKKIIKEIKWNYSLSLNFNNFLEELSKNNILPEHYLMEA